QNNRYVGFNLGDENQEHQDMKTKVTDEMERTFRPEFLNRIDETIVFHSLDKEHMNDIVKLMLNEVNRRMKAQEISFTITDKALEKVAEADFDRQYDARPSRRSLQSTRQD